MPGVSGVSVTDPPPFDTVIEQPPEDTGEEEELPPSSVCDYEEEEPNTATDPQPLVLEHWMCGVFGQAFDFDVFGFEADEGTWLRVWVRGSSLGSAANPRMFVLDDDEEFEIDETDSELSEEIDRTFKLDEDRELVVGLAEQQLAGDNFGPDNFWRMRVSIAKPPVRWDYEEQEPNDDLSEALLIDNGDRVYGNIESGASNDWFAVDVPEAGSEVVITTDSSTFGSPLNTEIEVRNEATGDVTVPTSRTRDRAVDFIAEEAGIYAIRVGSYSEKGSIPFWYVLDVSVNAPAE